MRIALILLLGALSGFGIHHYYFNDYDFSGTRWHCSETKAGFTSAAYKQYVKLDELTTLYFPTNNTVLYYQTGTLLHKSGFAEPYEVVLMAKNKVTGQRMEHSFTGVDWNIKPQQSPMFIRDKNSLTGFESDMQFYIDGTKLFFFGKSGSEDLNIACHQI